jgi:hypothetical protein
MQIQQKQNSANLNRMMEMMKLQKANESKAKCPKWEKEENVKKVLNGLENWDDVEKGWGGYIQLLEALQSSGRLKEKQGIELETQNSDLDPSDVNIVPLVIEKLKKWFGQTKLDEANNAWKSFRNIQRSKVESAT